MVRLVKELKTGTLYALKIYQKFKLETETKRNLLIKEIKILEKLNHPSIIKLYKVIEYPK